MNEQDMNNIVFRMGNLLYDHGELSGPRLTELDPTLTADRILFASENFQLRRGTDNQLYYNLDHSFRNFIGSLRGWLPLPREARLALAGILETMIKASSKSEEKKPLKN